MSPQYHALGLIILLALSPHSALGQSADAAIHAAPQDGGPRRLQWTDGPAMLRKGPSALADTISELPENSVFDNLGCQATAAGVWCHLRLSMNSPRGYLPASGLEPGRAPDGTVPMGRDTSPARARAGEIDATGEILCAQEQGETLAPCPAAITRGGGGDAVIKVTFPNGFARHLFFRNGEFVGANATMSGVGRDIDWFRDGDLHRLRVDDQQFRISDSFLNGS